MKNGLLRWLSTLLTACLLLAMPAAMMEEIAPEDALIEAEASEAEAPEAADEVLEAPVQEVVAEIGELAQEEAVTYEAEYAAADDWQGPVYNFHDKNAGLSIESNMQILLNPDHEGEIVRCTSSNPKVATVDESGVVTAYAVFDRTNIEIAYADGAVYTVKLTVYDPTIPRNIQLFVDFNTVIEKGESLPVDYEVRPGRAPQKVKWTTSDKKIATVSSKGVVKGVKAGTVTITATAPTGNNVYANFYVKVVDPDSAEGTGTAIDSKSFPNEIFRDYVQFHFDTNNDVKLSKDEIAAVKTMSLNGRFIGNASKLTSLKGIELLTGLEVLEFANLSGLKSVDLSKNTALKELSASDIDAMTSLNLKNNAELTLVDLHNNPKLKTLTLTNCKKLIHLEVCECALTSLNVKNCTKLEMLRCWENALTKLDISKNKELAYLDCNLNKLTKLNVSNNTALKNLNCGGNSKLAALDVSKNTKLEALSFAGTAIKTLDLSNCPKLIELTKTHKPNYDEEEGLFIGVDDDHMINCDLDVELKGVAIYDVITFSDKDKATAYVGVPVWVEPGDARAKSFKSSKTSVAAVNKTTGLVTPKKVGTAKITVTGTNGEKGVLTLKVASPTDPIGVAIKQGKKKTLKLTKKTLKLTATLESVKGYTAKTTLTWTSDNKAVAKVNKSTGMVTAVKKGKANITVKTKNGLTATIAITVN